MRAWMTLLVSAGLLGLMGCASDQSTVKTKQGAVAGAAAGAVVGAIIGNNAGGGGRSLEGALIGGAAGALGGGAVGSSMDEKSGQQP